MAWKLYSVIVVKKSILRKTHAYGGASLCLLFMLLLVAGPGMAWAGAVEVGGTQRETRIVFPLPQPMHPGIIHQGQTLIVNFPNTVGDAVTLRDIYMIESLIFDGREARITITCPFTYRTSLEDKPPRFILDLSDTTTGTAAACPIDHIETTPSNTGTGVIITFYLKESPWPRVFTSKNSRIYLVFDEEISCHREIPLLVSSVPLLDYSGIMKMQDGTAVCFVLAEQNTISRVDAREGLQKIMLMVDSTGMITPERRLTIARRAFDSGDVATAIRSLEPFRRELSTEENILLARAYWARSYPYRMDTLATEALQLMNQSIQNLSPGLGKEQVLLEYCTMLIHAGMFSDALNSIRILKGSSSHDTVILAYIQEIDILNRKGSYQDAFVANKRMLTYKGEHKLPDSIRGYYLSVLADTYLGLNAYARALELYRQAESVDPSLFRHDPDLFIRMGKSAFFLHDYHTARDLILSAINLGNPETKQDALLMLGDCLYQLNEKDKAVGIFSEVENIAPRSESGIIAKLRTTKILLEKDLSVNGSLSDKTFYEIMDIYEGLKHTQEYSEGQLGSIIKVRIAQTYALHGDWEESLEAYHRVWIETKPEDPVHRYAEAEAIDAILTLLNDLYTSGKYDVIRELYTTYQDSFIKGITQSEALFQLGHSLYELGLGPIAHPLLGQSIQKKLSSMDQALALLFQIDYDSGDLSQALAWNTLYIERFPKGGDARSMREHRGEILYLLGRDQEAIEYLEEFAHGEGDRALSAKHMLADIYRNLSRPREEAAVLDSILSLSNTHHSPIIEKSLFLRANQLRRTGEDERAITLYHELLASYPESTYRHWALYHLAQINIHKEHHLEAKDILDTILSQSDDTILLSAATSLANELDLKDDIHVYTTLKNRFGKDKN
ncbi:MAG: tetratricopeptide repeat protein [Desulfomonilia bacterium]